jgi:hypothetical protein
LGLASTIVSTLPPPASARTSARMPQRGDSAQRTPPPNTPTVSWLRGPTRTVTLSVSLIGNVPRIATLKLPFSVATGAPRLVTTPRAAGDGRDEPSVREEIDGQHAGAQELMPRGFREIGGGGDAVDAERSGRKQATERVDERAAAGLDAVHCLACELERCRRVVEREFRGVPCAEAARDASARAGAGAARHGGGAKRAVERRDLSVGAQRGIHRVQQRGAVTEEP